MLNAVKPIFLFNKMPRYGKHSGYEQLPTYVQGNVPCRTLVPRNSIADRIIGKLYSLYRRWPNRNQPDAAAELKMTLSLNTLTQAVAHILYAEYHLLYLDKWSKAPPNIIATIHEPPSRWQKYQLDQLRRLSTAIVLYQRDKSFFQNLIGDNVHFVAHGVDTEFFTPGNSLPVTPRIIFAGVHLRNNAMLRRVLLQLSTKHPSLRFDLVVNQSGRSDEDLQQLANHPAITWHHEISDQNLKTLYQSSYLMLLPMKDGGANNAVVESLASGLPIITTDCGGIRDYGGGDIYPLVENDDDQTMIDLVEKYLDMPDWRNEVSLKSRKFAESELAWPLIAEKHLDIYRTLL